MGTRSFIFCLLATAVTSHFVLDYPTSIGFDDEKLTEGPCGSFDPTDRSAGVTKWSIGGSNVGIISTHGDVTWEFNVALASAPANWLPLVQQFGQKGVGNVCFQRVPANAFSAWVGKPAILQVVQHGHDGTLYQCAAIEFVAGGPDPVPSGCTNSRGVTHDPFVAGPGPAPAAPGSELAPTGSSSPATRGDPSTTKPSTTSILGSTSVTTQSGNTAFTTSARPSHGHGGGDDGNHTHGDGHVGQGGGSSATNTSAVKTSTTLAASGRAPVVTAGAASAQAATGGIAALAAALLVL